MSTHTIVFILMSLVNLLLCYADYFVMVEVSGEKWFCFKLNFILFTIIELLIISLFLIT